jgi:hypothetical protein
MTSGSLRRGASRGDARGTGAVDGNGEERHAPATSERLMARVAAVVRR